MTQTECTPGPYWVRTNTNGSHDVCGRNAKIVRSYPADMVAAADQDCRRLQKAHSDAAKTLRDAAPDLLNALKECALEIAQIRNRKLTVNEQIALDNARAVIAKAEGR